MAYFVTGFYRADMKVCYFNSCSFAATNGVAADLFQSWLGEILGELPAGTVADYNHVDQVSVCPGTAEASVAI